MELLQAIRKSELHREQSGQIPREPSKTWCRDQDRVGVEQLQEVVQDGAGREGEVGSKEGENF